MTFLSPYRVLAPGEADKVSQLVDFANDLAEQNFGRRPFDWTGGMKVSVVSPWPFDTRLWVQVTPGDDDAELSVQWVSDDGHNAMDYDDLEDEEKWLV